MHNLHRWKELWREVMTCHQPWDVSVPQERGMYFVTQGSSRLLRQAILRVSQVTLRAVSDGAETGNALRNTAACYTCHSVRVGNVSMCHLTILASDIKWWANVGREDIKSHTQYCSIQNNNKIMETFPKTWVVNSTITIKLAWWYVRD